MEFLIAENKDKEYVKNLWKYCFTDNDEYVDYYFSNRYDTDNNYIIKEDETLKASLMANPYKINIGDNITKTSYVVGVSSGGTDRGKGYASYLIKETLKDRYSKGEDVSMLMAIDTKIYTRYGYTNIADMLEMDINLERIDVKKHKDIDVHIYDSANYIKDLMSIYDICSQKFGAFFIRDEKYFKFLIDEVKLEGGYIYIAYKNERPISYMLFYPKHILGQTGFVREIFSISNSGYDKLFEIIKSHFTQIKNIILHTNSNSYLKSYFSNDNKIIYIQKPFMMSRVINVKSVLSKLKFKENLCIKIIDDIIKDNNCIFELSTQGIEITDKKEDIKMDIYDFTSLYFGYIGADDIVFKNNLCADKKLISNLKYIFPKKENYFNDYV